ncbi:HalOD1 output domain-containing protein [Salinarchaeum laminariae]|uniref:HalOD1 output domain-containing protein n=1 Tax=Salinarchaeum laminariae TaxID=869888 RepID=UPI0020BD5393|nr:HalOD1 output domain-containing protein [Salinarchaeum laminariae]
MGNSARPALSVRVVRSLADARGVDPMDLGFRLGDAVDTDALDAMDDHDSTDWELEFEVDGHVVTVAPEAPVRVDGTPYR